jgi:predicted glycoside hydrolase/deacetylase ChbG (UPF0249 family)
MSPEPAAISLVVNADDFGASDAVSRGILEAHRRGIVTSTSVLGNCSDPAGAAHLLADVPDLGVGVHLTLSGGPPVAPLDRVRSLLGPDQALPGNVRDVFAAWARGDLRQDEVEHEFDAQVVRLRELGLKIDHLDTHRHVGFLPLIGRAVEAVAHRHGIAGIRMAVERPSLSWFTDPQRGGFAAALGGLAWFTRRQIGARRHGPLTWGYAESGQLDEVRILEILARLPRGCHELICHPGLEDDPERPTATLGWRHLRARELEALASATIRKAVERRCIRLCRWSDLF